MQVFISNGRSRPSRSQPPLQGHLPLTGLPKALSNLASNSARTGESTTSLGNLLHCLNTFTVRNFLLIPNLIASPFQCEAITPCPMVHYQVIKLARKTRIYLPNFIQHGFKRFLIHLDYRIQGRHLNVWRKGY